MQFSTFVVLLATSTGVMADLHNYATCNSNIQPVGNPNTCNKKRDLSGEELITRARSRIFGRAYGDNAAATRKACAAYRNRNTGNKMWDKCPDCTTGQRSTSNPNYCVVTCESRAGHIGGDEWLHYCRQAGADSSDAY
ncbi:hypothetical protein B0T11DRAFT_333612 [Plectosphaerella cucumerina]|uniref:Uncharacterized protein n=1 Tax=Plectosphaerella cucumerina TaxID=40658 RepID=A0A8K0WXV7_9PEZI|nr:hypothetical protein B0T11DRAFT_333612 [Plectosphaerella cucumerina]